MADRTLKELGVPKLDDEPLCIVVFLDNHRENMIPSHLLITKTTTYLQNTDTQIGQICTSLSNLESQLSGKHPSQPHPNPKEQVNVVMIRELEEANDLEEVEFISEESSNTINSWMQLIMDKFTPRKMKRSKMMYEFDSIQHTNHIFAMTDNTEVVLESNGEKIELDMIDKVLIHEANAIDYVANYLEQIGVGNLETNGM
ncbi:Phosphoglucosamine mutase, partial [Bienertia sinuspersici]